MQIVGWFVDNIHVYRTCEIPGELTITVVAPNTIILSWENPAGGIWDEWIHWDDGVNYTAVGTGNAAEFDVAVRWDPSQLAVFEGTSVTQVAFYPNEAQCTYSIKVWTGSNAANLVIDQPVPNPLVGQWNYIYLSTPLPLDITEELWIGYSVITPGGYPAGCDDGPAIDGYGNMINFGGWQTLLEINPELDYNWNIQGHIQTLAGEMVQLPNVGTQNIASAQNIAQPKDTRDLTGYNVYMSVDGGPYVLLDNTSSSSYTLTNLPNGLYCFRVSAVWESETDQCESALTEEECVVLTGNDELLNEATLVSLYPNPAAELVNIETCGTMERIFVYNSQGDLIFDKVISGDHVQLNVGNYSSGIYLVVIQTGTDRISRVLSIHH
jgi:hypothetical protein